MRYLLVDRIDELVEGVSAKARKNVAMTEDYLEWHFPEQPVVPGTLILEGFAQLAGWLEAASSAFERWVLLDHVTSARYFGAAVPGDRIDLVLESVPSTDPARRAYRGESTVNGVRKASVEFEGRVVPVESLDSRERMERAYKTLRGEGPAAPPPKRKP
jgi:3-hydroxyacyl-[acyl-carrier-protein] dehydratase